MNGYLTFGTDHKFPMQALKVYCRGNEEKVSKKYAKTFKVKEGAYAFFYTGEEWEAVVKKAPVAGALFCDEEDKTQAVQDFIKFFKPRQRVKFVLEKDVTLEGEFEEFNGSCVIINDDYTLCFVAIDYDKINAVVL